MDRSREQTSLVIFLSIALLIALLIAGGVALAASDDGDERVVQRGKVNVVVVDEDGNRHERSFEFDGDEPRAFLGVATERQPGGGARIRMVVDDSAAERAGLEVGDVIVGVNGEKLADPWQLSMKILESRPGDRIELEVRRDGQTRTLTPELGETDDWIGAFHGLDEGKMSEHLDKLREHLEGMDFDFEFNFEGPGLEDMQRLLRPARPRLGVQLVQPTRELREHLGAPADAGVLVSRVLPRMPAETAGVQVGDVIVAVDGNRVRSAGDLVRALADASNQTVRLELVRGGRSMTLDVFIPERDEEADGPSA